MPDAPVFGKWKAWEGIWHKKACCLRQMPSQAFHSPKNGASDIGRKHRPMPDAPFFGIKAGHMA